MHYVGPNAEILYVTAHVIYTYRWSLHGQVTSQYLLKFLKYRLLVFNWHILHSCMTARRRDTIQHLGKKMRDFRHHLRGRIQPSWDVKRRTLVDGHWKIGCPKSLLPTVTLRRVTSQKNKSLKHLYCKKIRVTDEFKFGSLCKPLRRIGELVLYLNSFLLLSLD